MNLMFTEKLKAGANMSRVMAAFREAGATIIRATYTKGNKGGAEGHWNIQYLSAGIAPDTRYV